MAKGDRRGQEPAVLSLRYNEANCTSVHPSACSCTVRTVELYQPDSSLIGQGIKMALSGSHQKSSYGGSKAETYSRLRRLQHVLHLRYSARTMTTNLQ